MKDTWEMLGGVLLVVLVISAAYVIGHRSGYEEGMGDGIAMTRGDKWDCAWSEMTGFAMCDRIPKYK